MGLSTPCHHSRKVSDIICFFAVVLVLVGFVAAVVVVGCSTASALLSMSFWCLTPVSMLCHAWRVVSQLQAIRQQMIDKATRELEATRKAADNKEEREVRPSMQAQRNRRNRGSYATLKAEQNLFIGTVAFQLAALAALVGVHLHLLRFVAILQAGSD